MPKLNKIAKALNVNPVFLLDDSFDALSDENFLRLLKYAELLEFGKSENLPAINTLIDAETQKTQ